LTTWPAGAAAPCILRDAYVFPAFESALGLLFLYALSRDLRLTQRLRHLLRRRRAGLSATLSVDRGQESREQFHLAYGLVSVIVLQIVGVAESARGYKVILSLINLAVVVYLCYFSGWMRNNIVRWAGAWQRRSES
jgi:hypothetical protein